MLSFIEILERAEKAKGTEAVLKDLVRAMDKVMGDSWEKKSNAARKKAVKKMSGAKTSAAGLTAALAVLTSELSKVMTAKEMKRFKALTDSFYRTAKKAASKVNKTDFVMNKIDTEVVGALSENGPYWIGDFYSTHLSERIAEVGYQAGVETGLAPKDAAKQLDSALKKEFARTGGPSTYESTVPARFAGRIDQYNQIVVSNVAQRARVYSGVASMHDAGIERYVFSAVMDERTTEICQEMNGRVFTVAQGMKHLEAVAEADSPEAFKNAHPWPANAEAVRAIAGTGSLTEQSDNLAQAGIPMPPLHGHCRSVVEAMA